MFKYSLYYKVYNTWYSELLGPKPDDVNHIYGVLNTERETPYTDKEIAKIKAAIAKAFIDNDSDVTPEDVIFITKEEYEANTSPDSETCIALIEEEKQGGE